MRIKYKLLDKMKNLKSTEMDFLLFVARFQNLKGEITGVHHSMVTKGTGMCKQSFYAAMRGLEQKGIIEVTKRSEIDWDILILDNDFSHKGAFQKGNEGYINLHRKVFHTKRFQNLKAHEKYMLMYFLKCTHKNSGSYRIGTKTFYEKFKNELHVSCRVIRSYLHKMRYFFSIGIKRGLYYITYKSGIFEQTAEKGVEDTELEAFVEAWCRRLKIKSPSPGQIHDTARLYKQYRPTMQAMGKNLLCFYPILGQAIQDTVQEEIPKNRKLNPAFVHKKVREALFGFC